MDVKISTVLALIALASQSHQQAQNFCGRQLSETLAMLCENGLLLEKKSGPTLPDYEEILQWPSMERHRARSMEMSSRGKRHVVDECCLKPCTLEELMSYCA